MEDLTENNGSLHYYAGSHRLPAISPVDLGISGEYAKTHSNVSHSPQHYGAYERFILDYTKELGLERKTVYLKMVKC